MTGRLDTPLKFDLCFANMTTLSARASRSIACFEARSLRRLFARRRYQKTRRYFGGVTDAIASPQVPMPAPVGVCCPILFRDYDSTPDESVVQYHVHRNIVHYGGYECRSTEYSKDDAI